MTLRDFQEASKSRPRGAQETPSWAQEAHKSLQVEPKRRPRAPSCTQEGVREGRKTSAIAVQQHCHCQKAKTSIFDDSITLLEVQERSGKAVGEQVGGVGRSGIATGGQIGDHFVCMEAKLELRRPSWSPHRLEQAPSLAQETSKRRPRGSKLGPRSAQEPPS